MEGPEPDVRQQEQPASLLLAELSALKRRVEDLERQLAEKTDKDERQQQGGGDGGGAAAEALAAPAPVPMGSTRVVMHQIVTPADVDDLGIAFGGLVLSWIDIAAGLAAKSLARGPCVTVSVDAVHFFRPCRRGDVVCVAAMVNKVFSSSMEVGVRVEAENMRSGERRHCCSAYLTFVSLNSRRPQGGGGAARRPTQLPRVAPTTGEHGRIHRQAEARRQRRLAAREAARSDPAKAAALAACRLKPVTHREGSPTLPPALTLSHVDSSSRGSGAAEAGGSLSQPGQQPEQQPGQQPEQQPGQQPEQQPKQPHHERGPCDIPTPFAGQGLPPPAGGGQPHRRVISAGATTAYMTQSIHPHHANTLNVTFGGQVLAWMEQCAYISASRLRGTHFLTAGMDEVHFAASTKVGDILYITAEVSAIFRTSLEVMISVFGESPASLAREGDVFHCADARATVVVVDLAGAPQAIPFQLEPATPAERLRFEGAQQRRAERLAMRAAMAAVASLRPSLDGKMPPPAAGDGG